MTKLNITKYLNDITTQGATFTERLAYYNDMPNNNKVYNNAVRLRISKIYRKTIRDNKEIILSLQEMLVDTNEIIKAYNKANNNLNILIEKLKTVCQKRRNNRTWRDDPYSIAYTNAVKNGVPLEPIVYKKLPACRHEIIEPMNHSDYQ